MKNIEPAERLLQDFGIESPEDIDLEAIAYAQCISIKRKPLDSCEARIVGKDEKAIITVNQNSSKERQRFSIAHELGHWHWHQGRTLDCQIINDTHLRRDKNSFKEERQADDFAKSLLMPNYIIRPIVNSYRTLTFYEVGKIAQLFGVSLTAAAIRLVELDIFPCFLVCYGCEGRKWFSMSRSIEKHWHLRKDLDKESYAFDLLYCNKSDDKPHTIGACAWFANPEASDFEIKEQSICIGQKTILTLLIFCDENML